MQKLIDYIEKFVHLDSDAISELYKLAEINTYLKNQHILEYGQFCNKIWYLKSGMARKYFIHEGKEITIWIYTENDTFTSYQSYSKRIPATEYLQATEDTEVISITRQNSEKLSKFPQFVTFSNALMEKEFVDNDIHSKELSQRDAKGKWEYLNKIAPEIIKRAKLGHIASILGVTGETLSRIRKR
jgi:CRP-like cAMP-binding protein